MTETPENIPQANQVLYSIKLVTGEELMCTLIDVTDDGMTIESPVLVRSVPILLESGAFENRLNTQSWMPYSSERIFYMHWHNVVCWNQLHPNLHKFYTKMVNKYETNDVEEQVSNNSFVVDAVDTIQ